MPVEGIAERPVVKNHIKRLVGLWNSDGPWERIYHAARAVEQVNMPRPTSAAGLERRFLQRKGQSDAEVEAMNVD